MTFVDRIQPFLQRPHVVILGAGASLAAFPNGDKNGRRIPLLRDMVDVVGIKGLLTSAGVVDPLDDFESLYSNLVEDSSKVSLVQELESRVFDYFSQLELPECPTLYDHLVLSLRPKDVIATFNWDPFLFQACVRNRRIQDIPTVLFLHGNVAIGTCVQHKPTSVGSRAGVCRNCGELLQDSRLLYPIRNKNYDADPFIATSWKLLRESMEHAYVLTVFGYSAPASDVAAIDLLRKAWGDKYQRNLEEIEIINIDKEDHLEEAWSPFIHTHHRVIVKSFYDSFIAHHPRRSADSVFSRIIDMELSPSAAFPVDIGWSELHEIIRSLIREERTYASHREQPPNS